MSTSTTPERSYAQRLEALERANEIRSARAVLKRNLKSGRTTIASVISSPPEYALTMKVVDAIVALPKLGRVKSNRAMTACRVAPSKTFGGLTPRQRGELVEYLRTHRPGAAAKAGR